jgi:hypothetical protein
MTAKKRESAKPDPDAWRLVEGRATFDSPDELRLQAQFRCRQWSFNEIQKEAEQEVDAALRDQAAKDPAIAALRRAADRVTELRRELAAADEEVKRTAADLKATKEGDLRGAALAQRLADLDAKAEAARRRAAEIKQGLLVMQGDLPELRDQAEQALRGVIQAVGQSVYEDGQRRAERARQLVNDPAVQRFLTGVCAENRRLGAALSNWLLDFTPVAGMVLPDEDTGAVEQAGQSLGV